MIKVELVPETPVSVRLQEAQTVALGTVPQAGIIKGRDAYSPYIGESGNWMCWDDAAGQWIDTGILAQGPKGDPGPMPEVDDTLTVEGLAADAKAAGDGIRRVRSEVQSIPYRITVDYENPIVMLDRVELPLTPVYNIEGDESSGVKYWKNNDADRFKDFKWSKDYEYHVSIDGEEYVCYQHMYADGMRVTTGAYSFGTNSYIGSPKVFDGNNAAGAAFPFTLIALQAYTYDTSIKKTTKLAFVMYSAHETVHVSVTAYMIDKIIPDSSAVEKYNNTGLLSSGNEGILEGYASIADGFGSHAEGFATIAKQYGSHAEGAKTKADGHGAHAEGMWTEAGQSAHAEGEGTIASVRASHAEGFNTVASGMPGSHAEGWGSKATEKGAHAEGYQSEASAMYAHAEGNSRATASYAHAEGRSKATGTSSHAENVGFAAEAYSHAEGLQTIASGACSHVEGMWNIKDEDQGNGVYRKYVHIVGNGTSIDACSNAHTLDWDGNAWFAGEIYVGSTVGTNRDEGSKRLIHDDELDAVCEEVAKRSIISANEDICGQKTFTYGTRYEPAIVVKGNGSDGAAMIFGQPTDSGAAFLSFYRKITSKSNLPMRGDFQMNNDGSFKMCHRRAKSASITSASDKDYVEDAVLAIDRGKLTFQTIAENAASGANAYDAPKLDVFYDTYKTVKLNTQAKDLIGAINEVNGKPIDVQAVKEIISREYIMSLIDDGSEVAY